MPVADSLYYGALDSNPKSIHIYIYISVLFAMHHMYTESIQTALKKITCNEQLAEC